jgi:hypothetical protein
VFEKAYKTNRSHVDRMRIELDDLVERGDRLNGFMESPKFQELPEEEQFLMTAQLGAMTTYGSLLGRRLAIAEAAIRG